MLTFTLILEPLWSTRPSCQPGVKHFLHTREKEVFFLNTLKISLAPTPQEGPFQVMIVGTRQQKEQEKLNTRESKGQDAAKIAFAPAESCIQCLWPMMPTTEDPTEEIDESRFVTQYSSFHLLMRMLCLCLALMNLLLCVAPPSSSLVTRAVSIPHWDVKSDYLSKVRDSPVWISTRDFLFPPDIMAMRTAIMNRADGLGR